MPRNSRPTVKRIKNCHRLEICGNLLPLCPSDMLYDRYVVPLGAGDKRSEIPGTSSSLGLVLTAGWSDPLRKRPLRRGRHAGRRIPRQSQGRGWDEDLRRQDQQGNQTVAEAPNGMPPE